MSQLRIFPAIDLRQGRVVRLEQGRAEAETVYGTDPVAVARGFLAEKVDALHVVDLDGAFSGEQNNLAHVRVIKRAFPDLFLELGGGLRTEGAITQALAAGVDRVIIGTRACESLSFVSEMVQKFGSEKIVIGLDARDGRVSTKGWTAPSAWSAPDLAQAVAELGIRTLIYTDIATDGMFTGPNVKALLELTQRVPGVEVIASGGIARLDHLRALKEISGVTGVIVGKALYDGKLRLKDLLAAARSKPSQPRLGIFPQPSEPFLQGPGMDL